MTDRKLITFRTIDEILPHNNADRLEIAVIGGWNVVIKKGEFLPGDTVIYCEPDTVLPECSCFEFLKGCFVNKDWVRGYRLRTMRLRGVMSQGLVLPLGILLDLNIVPRDFESYDLEDYVDYFEYHVGDLATAIGAVKWDPPIPACIVGMAQGLFPTSIVPKTDQARIQNLVLNHYSEFTYEVTEKLDGTSMTVITGYGDIRVCSRNLELKETEGNTLWEVARSLGLHEFAHRKLAFQGELCGPGIQGNPYRLKQATFFVFDIYDIEAQRYFTSEERLGFVPVGAMHVPVIHLPFTIPGTIKEILDLADGVSVLTDTPREGLVFKSIDHPSVSFKAISNAWLLNEA